MVGFSSFFVQIRSANCRTKFTFALPTSRASISVLITTAARSIKCWPERLNCPIISSRNASQEIPVGSDNATIMSAAVLWIRVGVANSRQILRVNLNFLRFAGDLGRVPALFNCDVYARHTRHTTLTFLREIAISRIQKIELY